MKFESTPLTGLLVVRGEPAADERGYFARTWCADEFAAHGCPFVPRQASVSFNAKRGTLRGLHWQEGDDAETKLVRVSRGRIFDVAVDLRAHRWFGIELSADNLCALLIPPGFAHGFITLEDESTVEYAMDRSHAPASARGARWDDPAFAIAWPLAPAVISERDLHWPAFAR